jgi:PTH1 family peptidyl-tRNA hydrolase
LHDRPQIVLGLGNPGARYEATRHNLGFRVVEELARRAGAKFSRSAADAGPAWAVEIDGAAGRLVLAQPRTYMNRSGRAGVALCERYGAGPGDVLVVHDDADLELGRLRLRPGGGAGGHNGVRSLMDAFRTDAFPRLRLGVRGAGRAQAELADYVLEPFDPDERPVAARLVELAAEVVEAVVRDGVQRGMNEYNSRFVAAAEAEPCDEEEG